MVRVALTVLLVASCAACSPDARALTVYSGRSEALVRPLLERFAEESGIDVDVRYGDTTDLALLISEERERSPADVFLSQSPGAVGFVDGKGLLGTLPAAAVDAVPAPFRDPTGRWVGVTGRQRVLVYNPDRFTEDALPTSIDGVVEPRFRGRLGVAPHNASFQDFVSAMRASRGDDGTRAWLAALARNDARSYANNNAIVTAVGRGEIDAGLANHYYLHQFLEEDPGLTVRNHVFPNGDLGSMVIVSSASVLKSSRRTQDAHRLVAFLLSRESQEHFRDETFEYPLVAGIEPAADLPALDAGRLPPAGLADLGERLEGTAKLIEDSGLDP